jgi:acetolactate synthase I/II/III large subunit
VQKLSDFVMEFIASNGVKHVFLLPGGGSMHLVDSLGRNPNIKYIVNLHEQASAIAAEAYAQYTNNLGVALVTTGPGGTNAITGVAAAWQDSTPCLFLSGQVKRSDLIGTRGVRQMGFQEIDIVAIVKSITKYAVTIENPDDIKYHLEKAVFLAKNGRPGPVWLDIPLDVQSSSIDELNLRSFEPFEIYTNVSTPDLHDLVLKTINLLNQSERPVILAGNGIRLSDGLDAFQRLVDLLKIPVLTTWKAMDFFDEEFKYYIGRPGSIGQRAANFAQQNSDLILILGARLDLGQTAYNHKNFARNAKKVMVDVDISEINKMQTKIDIPVCADASKFLREFLLNSDKIVLNERIAWLEKCLDWKIRYPVILPEYYEEKDFVNDYVLIDLLSKKLGPSDVLVPGSSGACSERTMQSFKVKKGMRIFNSEGLGPMGFGIPAAIGACIASGMKRTICIDGDGGFVMNIQDLETVKRLNLPIKFFVLNNQGYASIRASQNNYFNGRYVGSNKDSGLTLPDICKVAESFCIQNISLKTNSELDEKIDFILNSNQPVICEVNVNPDQMTSPRIQNVQKSDGTIISKPMEDLWPFLDRTEFAKNMILPISDDEDL